MATNINRKVIKKAIKEYGAKNEITVVIEELSELIKTLTKTLRSDVESDYNDICEELADVVIATCIVREVFCIPDVILEDKINEKQLRTLHDIYGYEEEDEEYDDNFLKNLERAIYNENSEGDSETLSED